MPIKDVKVLRLVRAQVDSAIGFLYNITSDPNVEPWFYVTMHTAAGHASIITKDGISYHDVRVGIMTDLTRIDRFTPKQQLIVQEAIKRYVMEL